MSMGHNPKYKKVACSHRTTVRSNARLDFAAVNAAAMRVLPSLLHRWLPQGHREGYEWCVGSLAGEPGHSLKINLRSGLWHDFATGEGGSDPVSLAAAIFRIKQSDACRKIAIMLGVIYA